MNKFRIPEGVSLKVVYADVESGLTNDPAFYVVGDVDTVAVVSVCEKVVYSVCCVGEMRIDTEKGDTLRYASDLFDAGIITDQDLWQAFDAECWFNNAWFEIWDETDGEAIGDVFHDVAEAIQRALDLAGDLVFPPKKISEGDVRGLVGALADGFTPPYLRCEVCDKGVIKVTEVVNGIGTWACQVCGQESYEYGLD